MSNVYDDIAKLTGVAREDVKRVLFVAGYSGGSFAPRLGDGSPDAALAIGEHAFRAGYEAAQNGDLGIAAAWGAYDPPEDIKALS